MKKITESAIFEFKKSLITAMLYIVLSAAFISIFFSACDAFNECFNLKNDNQAEEAFEGIIEHLTGVDIDLSGDDER